MVLAEAPITFPIWPDVKPLASPLDIDLISGLDKLLRRLEGDRVMSKIALLILFDV